MAARRLDHEWGRAVDSKDTVNHHQIFRIEEDKRRETYTLHYSVFHTPLDKKPNYKIPEKFIETMYGRTLETREERLAMEQLYVSLLSGIRPTGKNAGFLLRKPIQALTYDISFDPDYTITGFDVRPTMATMTEKLSCEEATCRLPKRREGREFRRWHDLILATENIKNKQEISFGEVTSRTTTLIQKRMCLRAFQDNIDCVYRVDPTASYLGLDSFRSGQGLSQNERIRRYGKQYGSVLEHRNENISSTGVVPTTASRNGVDSFNIAVITEFIKTGKNIFGQGVAGAVAQYKRHMMAWQYMDTQRKMNVV